MSSGDFTSDGVTQGVDVGLEPERLDDQHGSLSVQVGTGLLDEGEGTLSVSSALAMKPGSVPRRPKFLQAISAQSGRAIGDQSEVVGANQMRQRGCLSR